MSSLYYVTSAQVGTSPSFNIYIQESTDSGVSWSTVYDGALGATNFDVLLIGTVLHIFGDNFNGNSNLWVFRFDTSGNTMIDSGTDLGLTYDILDGVKAAQFATGKVLLAFHGTGATATSTYLYDPTLNTIGSGATLDQSGQRKVYGAVVDPGSDTAFVLFDGDINGDSPHEIDCVAVSNANVQQASVYGFSTILAGGNPLARNIGNVVMSGGKICVTYVYALSSSAPVTGTLRVARATPGNSPTFTTELVFTDLQPPYLWSIAGEAPFIPNLVDVSGTLYCFFQTSSDQNENSSSIAYLEYATSTVPGTWSSATTVITGPSSSDNLSCYPLALTEGGVGVIEVYCDPTSFPANGSWTVKYCVLPSTVTTVGSGQTFGSSLDTTNNGPTNLLFEVGGSVSSVILTFNFTTTDIPIPVQPIINPVQCINQTDLDAAGSPSGGSSPAPPPPPPPPPSVPVITTSALPGGTEDFYYTFFITATNAPTSWTATGLPSGMFIGPKNGNLVGTPSAPGTFSVVITAIGPGGTSAPVTLTLDIATTGVAPTMVSTSPMPSGNIGTLYSYQFTATGTSPITWSSLVPSVPSGMTLNGATGLFTWATPVAGTYNIQVEATNGAGSTGLVPFTFTISAVPLPPIPPNPPS